MYLNTLTNLDENLYKMGNQDQPIGMPQQYTDAGNVLIEHYGKQAATTNIENKIISLKVALEYIPKDKGAVRLNIGQQIDELSQTLKSINPPVLDREFFENLNPTK